MVTRTDLPPTTTPAVGDPPWGPAMGTGPRGPTPVLDSQALLRGLKEIHIAHNGLTYRLQATRQGKLILTK